MLFRSCISKINNTLVDNAQNLDIMSMYNLLEFSDNCSMRGSFWKYYRDEKNDDTNKNICAIFGDLSIYLD